jgi:hypothetical protein
METNFMYCIKDLKNQKKQRKKEIKKSGIQLYITSIIAETFC